MREVRYNRALIEEVIRAETEDPVALACCMAEEMDFPAFAKLEDSFVPIQLFFDAACPDARDEPDSSFRGWSAQLKTEADWVERIHLRTRILQARWRSG